jgi:hypothetical protein
MQPLRSHKPVTVAHEKTVAVQDDVRQARADLHEANETLTDSMAGAVVPKEKVEAALVQNLQVEDQLHDAVKELEVVTELLKVAEQDKATHTGEDVTMAGRRSGEGVESVLQHMAAASRRKNLNP